MNMHDAMDETTLVSVDEAIEELKKHGVTVELCTTEGQEQGSGSICLPPDQVGFVETITTYKDDEVSSLAIMEWLGY